MTPAFPLICPACQAALPATKPDMDGLPCSHCGRVYPLRFGAILDMRPEPRTDPGEQAIEEQLVQDYPQSSFRDLTAAFIRLATARDRYEPELVEHQLGYYDEEYLRGQRMIGMFLQRAAECFPMPPGQAVLDVGCGAGAALAALAGQFDEAAGIDIRYSSLLLCRKMLDERGIRNVALYQGTVQALPFAPDSFDFVTALNTLEHIFNLDSTLAEIQRVLKPGGLFTGDSRNRFDLFFAEPHVHLHWVGFLPRSLALRYVKWRTGVDYSHTRLFSLGELSLSLVRSFGTGSRVIFPRVSAYGQSARMDKLVQRLEKSWLRSLALPFFPSHLVVAKKGKM